MSEEKFQRKDVRKKQANLQVIMVMLFTEVPTLGPYGGPSDHHN